MLKLAVNPWISILKEPRKTIRMIVETNPKKGFYFLAGITVFSDYLMSAGRYFISFNMSFFLTSVFMLILSPFLGALLFYIVGWVLKITGGWLNGHAPSDQLRAVVAWANVPRIIVLFLAFVLLLFAPGYYFTPLISGPVFLFIRFILFITWIWQIVIFVVGISEVQKFSIGKAIGNYLLNLLVFFVFFLLVGFLVGFVRALFN